MQPEITLEYKKLKNKERRKMRMTYETPKMELVEVNAIDVITTSGFDNNTTPDDEL